MPTSIFILPMTDSTRFIKYAL